MKEPEQPTKQVLTTPQPGSRAAGGAPAGEPGTDASAAQKSRRVTDGASPPIIPDTFNPGIALRILIPAHVAAALFVLAQADGREISSWYEVGVVFEPALILSLVLLRVARTFANGLPRRAQWAIALSIPALVTCVMSLWLGKHLDLALGGAALFTWVAVRVAMACAGTGLAIEFLRLRAVSLSPSLSEARLQALQARIRPHFLFNSLNTVLGLIRSDPRRAEYTLENLSDLFRVFMRDTRDLVPMAEEIDICEQYLAIEQLRLGDRLQARVEVDEAAVDALVPALLLQPLVENAVHHGIEPRTDPGEVFVRVSRPGDRVRVEIVNPTSEQQPKRPGNQMALSNVRERLMLLYDIAAELKTVDEGGQFRVLLEYPYRKERRRRDVRRHFAPYR